MTKQTISLESLDLTKQCEEAFEFEYIAPQGEKTGVFISVIGRHSEKVQKFGRSEANRVRRQMALEQKRGKGDGFVPVEDDEDLIIRDAAVRINGWRGIDQSCTPENAELLCRINPEIRRQVVEASNELANFTRSK